MTYPNALYQIFYPYNKFDLESLHLLESFMYNKSFVVEVPLPPLPPLRPDEEDEDEETMVPDTEKTVESIQKPVPLVQKPFLRIPHNPDSLFWSMYIHHYGYEDYLAIGNKYTNVEMVEKQKIMEHIKPTKNSIRTADSHSSWSMTDKEINPSPEGANLNLHRFKSSKYSFKNMNRKITLGTTQEIMSELMTNSKTSLLALHALSLYYKVNVCVENTINGTYLEYIFDKESPSDKWVFLKYTDRKKYGLVESEPVKPSGILIESHDKPLRGISTYKLAELNAIADKIPAICKDESRVAWKKPELYGKLWHALLWQ